MKKVSFEELAARAEQRKRSRTEEKLLEVPQLGALEFVKPSETATISYYARLAEAASAEDALALSSDMIYECCPALQDAELHAALGARDPADVVPALLTVMERDGLGMKLLAWCGLMPDAAEDTVKN